MHRVVPVSEFAVHSVNFFPKRRSLFVRTLNHFPQKTTVQPLSVSGTIWLCSSCLSGRGPLAARSHGGCDSRCVLQRLTDLWLGPSGLLQEPVPFIFEPGSREPLSSLEGDHGGVDSMVRLRVLLLEVRKHQSSSQLTRTGAYDLSF